MDGSVMIRPHFEAGEKRGRALWWLALVFTLLALGSCVLRYVVLDGVAAVVFEVLLFMFCGLLVATLIVGLVHRPPSPTEQA